MTNVYKLYFFVTLLCLIVRERGVDGGFNSVSGHVFTSNSRKIKTGFYFAIRFYYTLF